MLSAVQHVLYVPAVKIIRIQLNVARLGKFWNGHAHTNCQGSEPSSGSVDDV